MRFIDITERYLEALLGLTPLVIAPCARSVDLPFYLQEAFDLCTLKIAGQTVILVHPKPNRSQSLREIRVHLARMAEFLGAPTLLWVETLAPYERRNLIQQHVPFLVPGNQLYLPPLGIDLREYFPRSKIKHCDAFTPSTQALFIWFMLNQPVGDEWQPSVDAAALGYSAMTAGRAIDELVQANVAQVVTVGRRKLLRLLGTREQAWDQARPFLRSPVKRTVWAQPSRHLNADGLRMTGLTALAEYSLLDAPKNRCLAMNLDQWRTARENGVRETTDAEPDAILVEIWAYEPAMRAHSKTVDVVSLWLSLQGDDDPRVQTALDELRGKFPW